MATVPATTRTKSLREYLGDEKVKGQLKLALPKHISVDRMLRVMMTTLQRQPRLQDCTPKSLLGCLMTAGQLGLEPDPILGQAYLVPYRNKGNLEAQLIPGYRGLLALARRSGEVSSIQAQVVYSQDKFEIRYGLEERLDHVPADGDRGEPKGAYVVFRYKDGSHSMDYMSRADIEKIRARSKSPTDGPWVTDWDEMAKKTVIRRHCKVVPLSVEIQKAFALQDRFEAGESQMDLLTEDAEPIDTEPVKEIEAAAPGMVSGEDYLREQLFSKVPEGDHNALAEFIEQTCTANRASVGDVVDQATRNLDGFLKAFQTWRAKRAGNGDNPEAKLIAEFSNLRTPGLREYLLSRSAEIPTFPGAVKAALERKCRAVLNMTLVEALAQVGSPVREPQTGAVLGDGPKKPCPDLDGDEVYESTCAECEGREGCPEWE